MPTGREAAVGEGDAFLAAGWQGAGEHAVLVVDALGKGVWTGIVAKEVVASFFVGSQFVLEETLCDGTHALGRRCHALVH